MGRIQFAVVAALSFDSTSATAGPDRMVGAAGSATCAAFNYAVSRGPNEPGAQLVVAGALNWTMGFLSATHDALAEVAKEKDIHTLADGLDGDLLRGITEDDVITWLKLDCERRPQQAIRQAARRLIVSIIARRQSKQ